MGFRLQQLRHVAANDTSIQGEYADVQNHSHDRLRFRRRHGDRARPARPHCHRCDTILVAALRNKADSLGLCGLRVEKPDLLEPNDTARVMDWEFDVPVDNAGTGSGGNHGKRTV